MVDQTVHEDRNLQGTEFCTHSMMYMGTLLYMNFYCSSGPRCMEHVPNPCGNFTDVRVLRQACASSQACLVCRVPVDTQRIQGPLMSCNLIMRCHTMVVSKGKVQSILQDCFHVLLYLMILGHIFPIATKSRSNLQRVGRYPRRLDCSTHHDTRRVVLREGHCRHIVTASVFIGTNRGIRNAERAQRVVDRTRITGLSLQQTVRQRYPRKRHLVMSSLLKQELEKGDEKRLLLPEKLREKNGMVLVSDLDWTMVGC